jgi:hypothetical protein
MALTVLHDRLPRVLPADDLNLILEEEAESRRRSMTATPLGE